MRRTRVLLVGHEASQTGAPMSLLRLAGWLKERGGIDLRFVLGTGGPLLPQYQAVAPAWVWRPTPPAVVRLAALPYARRAWGYARRYRLRGRVAAFAPDLVYVNTAAAAEPATALSQSGTPVIVRVAELEMAMRETVKRASFETLKRRAAHFVAVSEAVKTNLRDNHGIAADAIDVIPGFLPSDAGLSGDPAERRRRLCARLGLDPEALFVGGAGTFEHRKGPDLLVQVARVLSRRAPDRRIVFLWLGGAPPDQEPLHLRHDVAACGLASRFRFLGIQANPLEYLDLYDVLALTSREDPYPLVLLEAAALGKPAVCFDQSGGAPEFVEKDAGFVVPYMDVDEMADRILMLLESHDLRVKMGEAARRKAIERHRLEHLAPRVLQLIDRHCRAPK
jgi:glycosyltransferase involved in cell wall biosynthesis